MQNIKEYTGVIQSDEVFTVDEFLKKYVNDNNELSENMKNMNLDSFEERFPNAWTYPLSEIEHIIDMELEVVIVKFITSNSKEIYRFVDIQNI